MVGADGASGRAIDSLTRLFRIDIPLQDIPFHVRVKSLTVGPDGVAIMLAGQDLVYTR